MARAKEERNGRLEEAMRDLLRAQANLVQCTAALEQGHAAHVAEMREINKEIADLRRQTDERFARIEAILMEHSRILADHTQILHALPEAVREKFGFRPPQ